jgi:hypothetical protein
MEFESIFVSKALPDVEFSQKAVIDAHRSITSSNHVRHLTSGAIRSSGGKFGRFCLYTRKRLPQRGFVQVGLEEVNSDMLAARFWRSYNTVISTKRMTTPVRRQNRSWRRR